MCNYYMVLEMIKMKTMLINYSHTEIFQHKIHGTCQKIHSHEKTAYNYKPATSLERCFKIILLTATLNDTYYSTRQILLSTF